VLIVPPWKKLQMKCSSFPKSCTVMVSASQFCGGQEPSLLWKRLQPSKVPSMKYKWCGQHRECGSKSGIGDFQISQSMVWSNSWLFHFMEDLIVKLHNLDRLTDAVYCHIQDYEFHKECKQKQKPPLWALPSVDSLTKCNISAIISLLLKQSQIGKARLRRSLLSKKSKGRCDLARISLQSQKVLDR
jgi:hypothetical protein